jgi:hypothetical protein
LFCSIRPDVAICMSGFEVDLNLPAGAGALAGSHREALASAVQEQGWRGWLVRRLAFRLRRCWAQAQR